MKKSIIFYIGFVCLLAAAAGCKKERPLDADIDNLGGETWPPTAVDTWLEDTLNIPYNMQVKYRWDAFELELDKTLVPPALDKVVPTMQLVKRGWMDVYEDGVSANFLKTFCPKQYVLVGSLAYNTDGTVLLGEAEAGRKVTLYRVNQLNRKDSVFVKRMLKTVHHEFAHILCQNIMYTADFEDITASGYTASWADVTDANARSKGFITAYAMSEPFEDFAEMVAVMLTEGKARFNGFLGSLSSTAQAALRRKEQMVVDYYADNYNIDFYSLQTRARDYETALWK